MKRAWLSAFGALLGSGLVRLAAHSEPWPTEFGWGVALGILLFAWLGRAPRVRGEG